MDKMLTSKGIKQFLSYFGVGGVSALVEWAVFSLLEYLLDMPYLLATILAFIFSTTSFIINCSYFIISKNRNNFNFFILT